MLRPGSYIYLQPIYPPHIHFIYIQIILKAGNSCWVCLYPYFLTDSLPVIPVCSYFLSCFWLLPVPFHRDGEEALGNVNLGGSDPTGHVCLKNGAWV